MLRDNPVMHLHVSAILEMTKLTFSKKITKVDQFDSPLSCQQDVVAFDIAMDNPVVVQMLETLLS